MRILHTADWHLGRVLHGASLLDDQAYLLDRLVDLARDEHPDVILIAGDVYDRSVPPAAAVDLLDDVLARLVLDLRIPVVAIAGNHDSPERLSFASRLLRGSGLHLAGSPRDGLVPVVLGDDHGPVTIHPVPYLEPAAVRQALAQPDLEGVEATTEAQLDAVRATRIPGGRSVLVGHAFVAGMQPSESERPLSLGGSGCVDPSVFHGFDYVALGHLHRPQRVAPGVRYAGSLMRYSFQEADQDKAALLVELGPPGTRNTRQVALTPRRQVRVLDGTLDEVLAVGRDDPASDDYVAATLRDDNPLFDAMGRLRKVYPNALHIELPVLLPVAGTASARVDHRRTSDLDLFSAFFRDMKDRDLDEGERARLVGLLGGLDRAAAEVDA